MRFHGGFRAGASGPWAKCLRERRGKKEEANRDGRATREGEGKRLKKQGRHTERHGGNVDVACSFILTI